MVPMFERFTNRARHVVVLAQEEARGLQHNYIGTEHILLGLLGEPGGVAAQALDRFGVTLGGAREEVKGIIGIGKGAVSGHIIREGEGVGAQVLKEHADLMAVRMAVLDLVPAGPAQARGRRWLRRLVTAGFGEPGEAGGPGEPGETTELRTTPAADTSLDEAARLAGPNPVGSHHLLLAALADPDAAAARALASLGVDLDQARETLRNADVTGTSDEPPEEAGRRQMLIRVTEDRLTIEATDQVIVRLGRASLDALGDRADPPGTIRGELPAGASLSNVWLALRAQP